MSVSITGLAELQKTFKKAPDLVEAAFTKALGKATLTIEGAAKPITPIDTGFLRNSMTTGVEKLVGRVINTAPYAMFVHEGTAKWPLSIPPKNSNTVRQFFTGAVDQTKNTVDKYWEEAAKEVVDNLAK